MDAEQQGQPQSSGAADNENDRALLKVSFRVIITGSWCLTTVGAVVLVSGLGVLSRFSP